MAQTEGQNTLLLDLTRQEERETVGKGGEEVWVTAKTSGVADELSTTSVAVADPVSLEKPSTVASEPLSSVAPTRPSLVPLGSTSNTTSTGAPQPKKFSAVNINKKFLEKNSSTAGSLPTSSSSLSTKSGNTTSRPTVQTMASHSRLVTAKLTATPVVSSSTAGWSRPSSVAPSTTTGNNSPNSTSPLPTAALVSNLAPAAPQLPNVGKVIQPQPRAAVVQLTATQKEPANHNKPVWGNVKPPGSGLRPEIQQNDFPTAAEVAKVPAAAKKIKTEDVQSSVDKAAKQARMEEADTFRGVHLDPNAHHWDEMEEDDDNFLGGVIEFGDGRQYKVESNDVRPTSGSPPVTKQERFVDDFDRSWPRSRTSPTSSSKDVPSTTGSHEPSISPIISPIALHNASSPQESSRVLFNERSNRLEPYNYSARQGQTTYTSKRSSFHESSSLAEPRNGKDFGGSNSHNVQVLHKPVGGEGGSHGRRFSGGSNGFGPGSSAIPVTQRERDHPPRRDGPPPSPRLSRDVPHPMSSSASMTGRERDSGTERGRRTTMGPPPVPLHALKSAQDGGRQLPPHLTQVSPNIPMRRLPSREPRISTREPIVAGDSRTTSLPSHSPVTSHASLSAASPVADPASVLSLLPVSDLEEVRKDVMQSAAARAKQRRQQEEAEREAQKERARRKAQEMEGRIIAAEAEKAKQKEREEEVKVTDANSEVDAVSAVIEEAIKSVGTAIPSSPRTDARAELQSGKPFSRRPPPLKDTSSNKNAEPLRSAGAKRAAVLPLRGSATSPIVSPTVQTESWRSKANPLPPAPTSNPPRQIHPRAPVSGFSAPPPSALDTIIVQSTKEDLEVVDFSEMGTFVAVSDPTEKPLQVKENGTATSRRPVASDFFEDVPETNKENNKADFGTWRRKVSVDYGRDSTIPPVSEKGNLGNDGVSEVSPRPGLISQSSLLESNQENKEPHRSQTDIDSSVTGDFGLNKDSLSQQDHHNGRQVVNLPPHSGVQRTPRSQTFYKEAAMSALDDAMSRIKGALVGMQSQDTPKDGEPEPSQTRVSLPPNPPHTPLKSPQKERWVPPALRLRNVEFVDDQPLEVFNVTAVEPPRSPVVSPTASLVVRLPGVSRLLDFVHKRQLHIFQKPPFPARFELLTFEPPVEGMSKRDFSVNEVLFRKPPYFKGKLKYRVFLPKQKAYSTGPKVQIPSSTFGKPNATGAFGRPTVADGASSWRKPAGFLATKFEGSNDIPLESGLDTMSRSPPPDTLPSDVKNASIPKSIDSTASKIDVQTNVRPRAQPKMPAGSAVAFFRDSRIDVIEADAKPSVNFIVSSELEESKDFQDIQLVGPDTSTSKGTSKGASSNFSSATTSFANTQATNGTKDGQLPSAPGKAETNLSEDMADRNFMSPSNHQGSSWARSSLSAPLKESPSRGPDPEHLKALWSQTSNTTELHTVNSLEGIADDFTSLPFTLQDVKSEDGETPPPSVPQPPSRMSLHEVTRAFQQVPQSSSSNVAPRTPISPPSTSAPVARPSYSYTPMIPNNIRPTYAPYPSPMMSHSPTPVMYPHPMTASPVPARMQVNGHTPLYSQPVWMTQNSNNMMRPMASPYPAQMIPYPASSSPNVYHPPPPNMLINQTPQNGTPPNRRNMSVMSPVMSHAPMYPASPLLMHAPVMQVPQNHPYMTVQGGRGQTRPDNGQLGPQHGSPAQQPSHITYTPVPSSPFARSAWS